MGIATGEDCWADGFAGVVSALAIATKRDPFSLAEVPRGDFSSGELELLGRVSAEDKSNASLVSLTALAFFFDPFGIGGEERAMAFIGGVSLLAHFDAVAITLGPLLDLFMVEEPPRVFIILLI